MVVLRKVAVLILILSLLLYSYIPTDSDNYTILASSSNLQRTKIIIDAGHGGFDGGASADDGTMEKNINLQIALSLKEFCELGGYDVILTRVIDSGTEKNEDESIANRKKSDMRRRLEIINENPDAIFVSIHLNKFTNSSAKGAQVFYSANNDLSATLAETVQNTIISMLQPNNTRVIKKAGSSIYLLKNSHIPSIIVECGFLSNLSELALLKDSNYQSKMAFSIYCGILNYYNQE